MRVYILTEPPQFITANLHVVSDPDGLFKVDRRWEDLEKRDLKPSGFACREGGGVEGDSGWAKASTKRDSGWNSKKSCAVRGARDQMTGSEERSRGGGRRRKTEWSG